MVGNSPDTTNFKMPPVFGVCASAEGIIAAGKASSPASTGRASFQRQVLMSGPPWRVHYRFCRSAPTANGHAAASPNSPGISNADLRPWPKDLPRRRAERRGRAARPDLRLAQDETDPDGGHCTMHP